MISSTFGRRGPLASSAASRGVVTRESASRAISRMRGRAVMRVLLRRRDAGQNADTVTSLGGCVNRIRAAPRQRCRYDVHMRSPFPGMDPYLESRWSDVHASFIHFTKAVLQPQ